MTGILTPTCKFNLDVCRPQDDSSEAQWSHITPHLKGLCNCIFHLTSGYIKCIAEDPISKENQVNII